MPEICRFFGIVIMVYYADHPPPHFHVRYGGQKGIVSIEPLALIEGNLSPRVLGMVTEWAALHHEELLENWDLARQHLPLRRVKPLE